MSDDRDDEKATTVVLPEVPTPEAEMAQDPDAETSASTAPPPTIHRYPVWVYFIGYLAEMPHRKEWGSQLIKVPQPIDATAKLREIEALLARHARFQTHGIVGNRPRITLTAVTQLGQMLVEETVTPEGEQAAAVEDAARADQHTES